MNPDSDRLKIGQIFKYIFTIFLLFSLPGLEWTIFGWIHFLTPLVIFVYLHKFGWNVGNKLILFGFLSAFVFSLALQFSHSIFFSLTLIPLGYVINYTAKRNDPPVLAGFKGVIVQCSSWLIYGLTLSSIRGKSLYHDIIQSILDGINAAVSQYRVSEELPAETLITIEQTFYHLKTVLPIVLPSFFMSCVVIIVSITMAAGNNILLRQNHTSPWEPFRNWQLPDKLIWLVIGSGLFTLLNIEPSRTVGINLLIVFSVVYCIQGFSIFSFFMNKWKFPRFFKTVLYITVIFQSFGTAILLTLGLSSVWINYRSLGKSADTDEIDD